MSAEGAPSERKEGAPVITKAQVVEQLRANPENLAPYIEWLKNREAQVERANDAREGMRLMFESGEVLRDAGIVQGAREAFEQTMMQAEYEDHELYLRAQEELEKLPHPS